MRLQRREHYRMRVPPGETLACELRSPPGSNRPLQSHRVYDISCGGLALVDWPEGAAPETHRIYRGCRLLLPDDDPLVADLEVVYVLDRTEADGKRVRRAGARFVDLAGKHVTHVQRYITRLERRAEGAAGRAGGGEVADRSQGLCRREATQRRRPGDRGAAAAMIAVRSAGS